MCRPSVWCLIGTLVFSLGPRDLEAEPIPVGGEFRVNTTTSLDQSEPQVAMDANGNSVVVWVDGGGTVAGIDGSSDGIVGQRFDSTGNPVGGEFIVNTETAGRQGEPAVAMDPAGNFLVVWIDTTNFGGNGDGSLAGIEGQLFDSSGNKVGGQLQVNEETLDQQIWPNIAADDEGEFIVTWGSFETTGANQFARRIDADGNPVGGQFQVNTELIGRQYRSDIDFADNGDFVIAWRSTTDSGSVNYDIAARRFDSTDTPLGNQFQVNVFTTGTQRDVDLAVHGDGSFMVVWASSSQGDIFARRFDSTGSPIGGDFLVNTYTTGTQTNPQVALDSQGNATVVWVSTHFNGRDVFGQQLDAAGDRFGDEFQVNTFTPRDQGYGSRGPDLAMDPNGNFIVTWQDSFGFDTSGRPGQDGDGDGVYARLFESCFSPPDPNLIGHWPLDDGSGSTATNSAGNGLDGTLEGGAGWTPGQQATGSSFNGSDALIRIEDNGADSPIDVTDGLTIAAWVRPDDLDGSHQVLVSKDDSYELELGKLGASVWDLRLNNLAVRTASTPVEQGVWQHLAMTWDGAQACSYYNGLLEGCSSFATTLTPNDRDLGFGARPAPLFEGGPAFHFNGALDEVYVYNRGFTGTEIADLVLDQLTDITPPVRANLAPAMALPLGTTLANLSLDTDGPADCEYSTTAGTAFGAGTAFASTGGSSHSSGVPVVDGGTYTFHVRCRDAVGNTNTDDVTISFGVGDSDLCSALAGSWGADEGTGCTIGDSTGANVGTLGPNCPSNAPTWVTGRTGSNSALSFDGNDDQVRIDNPTGLSGRSGVTISAWIQHDPAGNWRSIVDRRKAGNDGYDLYIRDNSKLFMRVNDFTLTGNMVVADGQWHHVVGTYDGSEMKLYVDGQLDASRPADGGSLDVSSPLFIGRYWQNTQNAYAGLIDEVAIHGRALPAIEVLELANAGIPVCAP